MEDFPWAESWARTTTTLSNAVSLLAREVSWQGTARHYGLNWKSVATIVKRAVAYGLRNRARPPVHVIGIDEVSRRKGQVYLTVVYDLERRVLLWVGDERTEEAVEPFFTKEMGKRRCQTLLRGVHGYVVDIRQSGAETRQQCRRSCLTDSDIVKHLNEVSGRSSPRGVVAATDGQAESLLQRHPLAVA